MFISEIEKIEEKEDITSDVRNVINVFLSAINDWPYPSLTLEDYETQLKTFINSVPCKASIKEALNKIDHLSNAWQSESLAQILDVYHFYDEELTLKEIIQDLLKKITTKR